MAGEEERMKKQREIGYSRRRKKRRWTPTRAKAKIPELVKKYPGNSHSTEVRGQWTPTGAEPMLVK